MDSLARDQAEGLRRLFGGRGAIVEMPARPSETGGVPPARSLAEPGREVLVFDCTPAAAAPELGMRGHFGPADRMSREQRLEDAIAAGALAQDILLVVSPEAAAITGGYTLIKRLAPSRGQRRFRLLVERARSEEQALKIFRNMACATWRYLRTELNFSGWTPEDERILRAGRLPPAEDSPSSSRIANFRQAALSRTNWPGADATPSVR